ncbi:hypothetical protein J6590_004306 [Homalodisca vitripennis]|nr:hypothetical protein J6590_004306 [Homalodisca vitripennis]
MGEGYCKQPGGVDRQSDGNLTRHCRRSIMGAGTVLCVRHILMFSGGNGTKESPSSSMNFGTRPRSCDLSEVSRDLRYCGGGGWAGAASYA